MSDLKLTTRAEDFSEWYNQVVLRAELADYAPSRTAARSCTRAPERNPQAPPATPAGCTIPKNLQSE